MSTFVIPPDLLESLNTSAEGLKSAAKKFTADPLIPGKYSQITSIVSSAQKRHGNLLEQAILARLKQSPGLEIWTEPEFNVSSSAEALVSSYLSNPELAKKTDIPYQQSNSSRVRSMQIDLIAYDKTKKSLISYEIKRGNGMHDSKSKAAMLKNLVCQQTLLKSYGEQKGFKVSKADSKAIFYYGKCSLPKEYSLVKEDLDSHFDFSLVEFVEEVTELYRQKVIRIVEELIDPEASGLREQIASILSSQLEKQGKEKNTPKDSWLKSIFIR
ncbi:hypothetical protein OAC60_02490 [Amylibacter sp.]|nr:hypothetical protein [Amylibacter sp.]